MTSQNTMQQDNAPLIDIRQLDQFICIGPSDFLEILDDVVQDVAKNLEKIHSAILAGDPVEMKFGVHSMRGMLASLGCVGMTAVLHELEYGPSPPPGDAELVQSKLAALWQQSHSEIMDHARSIDGFLP